MHTIYTVGYSGWAPAALRAHVATLGARLWDIRMSPRSRSPQWSGSALRALVGPAYAHVPALGNRNYKSGGPIELANPVVMVEAAAVTLAFQPLVLLCGCKDWRTCHRLVAAEYLAEWTGAEVQHLGVPAKEAQP